MLLWTLYGRDVVASIVASVTILSLAIEPFSQELIHCYNCKVPVTSDLATVSRTSLYN